MIRRILAVCSVEWMKSSRSPWPYLGVALVVALVAGTLMGYPLDRDGESDFGFIAQAVPAAMNLAGLLIVLVYSANLVAGEVDSGVIRTVLVRPVRRHEWLAGKLIHGIAYVTLLLLAAVVASWALALALGDLSGIAYGDELTYTTSEIYLALLAATLLNLPPYYAAVAFAVFVSTLWRRPAATIGAAIGAWLLMDTLKHLFGVSAFVFTTFLDQSWIVFQDRCNALGTPFFPEMFIQAGLSLIWFLLFAGAAIFAFGRQNFGP